MKFAIFNEIVIDDKKRRKVLVEWNRDRIEDALVEALPEVREYNVRKAFSNVIEKFKKETIRIP